MICLLLWLLPSVVSSWGNSHRHVSLVATLALIIHSSLHWMLSSLLVQLSITADLSYPTYLRSSSVITSTINIPSLPHSRVSIAAGRSHSVYPISSSAITCTIRKSLSIHYSRFLPSWKHPEPVKPQFKGHGLRSNALLWQRCLEEW